MEGFLPEEEIAAIYGPPRVCERCALAHRWFTGCRGWYKGIVNRESAFGYLRKHLGLEADQVERILQRAEGTADRTLRFWDSSPRWDMGPWSGGWYIYIEGQR